MAGLGRKVFAAGDVLAAADVDGYLMDQTVMTFAGTAARSSAIGTASEGMYTYLSDTNDTQFYNGSAWESQFGKGRNFIINEHCGLTNTVRSNTNFTLRDNLPIKRAGRISRVKSAVIVAQSY